MKRISFRGITALIILLSFTTIVEAVDGVTEISQAGIEAGGGFPYLVTSPGTYRLTSNLDVRGETSPENVTAIRVLADDVTVDLNGFRILGPTVCSGPPVVCGPVGTGVGVEAATQEGVTIRNGTVRGMGGAGVTAGPGAHVFDLQVASNGGPGLSVQPGGYVEGVTATWNRITGITVLGESTVTHCVSSDNREQGIAASGESNILTANNLRSNSGDGIYVESSALVEGNIAMFNGGYGLRLLNAHGGYKDNVLHYNNLGQVSGGTQLDENLCGGNTTCP
jgi:hypothetical protein